MDHLKILWIAQISKGNSFSNVSMDFIRMINNFSKCQLYTLDIGNDIRLDIVDQMITNIAPDIVIILHNIGNLRKLTQQLSPTFDQIGCKILYYCPIENSNLILQDLKCHLCLTMNVWGATEIERDHPIYPVQVLEHIVEGFYHFNQSERTSIRKKYYGDLHDRYIIGVVNANNSRKKLDLSIRAFRLFHEMIPNSLLVIKTTYPSNNNGLACVSYHNLRKFMDNIPVIIIRDNISKIELNELYNSFDLMINTTDGEGFGLIPFEAALSGTLSVLPFNSSFIGLLATVNDGMPRYCVPCTQVPCEYSRYTDDYLFYREGNDVLRFLTATGYTTHASIVTIIERQVAEAENYFTYTISLTGQPNTFSTIEEMLEDLNKNPKNNFQIQVSSDLESLKYYVKWDRENIIQDQLISNLDIVKTNVGAIEKYIGENTPHVGIVDIKDVAEKIFYYYHNPTDKKNDMLQLQNYVKNHLSSRTIFEKLVKILGDL